MCGNKHHYERHSRYDDIKFEGGVGKIDFPNGFTMIVKKESVGFVESVAVQDAPNEFKNVDYIQNVFPGIDTLYYELHRKADVRFVKEAIKRIENLTEEDWKKFHEK